jgi:hypothetical protein
MRGKGTNLVGPLPTEGLNYVAGDDTCGTHTDGKTESPTSKTKSPLMDKVTRINFVQI